MRIAIVGAGALGGTFGFRLSEAGHDVVLVDVDAAKVAALNAEGLTLVLPDGSVHTRRIRASTDPSSVGPVDVVQIAVKSYHTEGAARLAVPLVGPDTYVLSLQNGLNNLQIIADVVGPERVVGGVVGYSAMAVSHTVIRFGGGGGGIHVGRYDGTPDPGLERLVEALRSAGFEAHAVEGDVREPIWRKLVANVSVNAVAALTGLTGREILEIQPARELVDNLARETADVALAQGFSFAELADPGEWVLSTLDWVGDNKVSMLQDMEAGRKTEIEALNLAVVDRGETFAVDTPLNWVIGTLVKIREEKTLRDRSPAESAPQVATG